MLFFILGYNISCSQRFYGREAACNWYVFTNVLEKLNDHSSFLLGPSTNILMSAIKGKAFTSEIGFWNNWPVGDI